MDLRIDSGLPVYELLLNLGRGSLDTLHPRVLQDLVHVQAVLRVQHGHHLEELPELCGVDRGGTALRRIVRFPKQVTAAGSQQLVVRVVGVRAAERRSLRYHDEQDDRCGKQVHCLPLVRLAQVDLWRHVRMSAQLGVQVT